MIRAVLGSVLHKSVFCHGFGIDHLPHNLQDYFISIRFKIVPVLIVDIPSELKQSWYYHISDINAETWLVERGHGGMETLKHHRVLWKFPTLAISSRWHNAI